MPTGQERRKHQRFPMTIPVLLDDVQGEARDVSVEGIYFYADLTIKPDTDIAFSLQFEHDLSSDARPLYFACRGKVMRIEKEGGRNGLAVRFTESQHTSLFA